MKEILLSQGRVALVDDDMFEYLNQWKWYCNNGGYATRNSTGLHRTIIRMHREIMNTPNGMETDHINGNSLDNRKENLRVCTHSENMHNRKVRTHISSGYKGVHWHRHNKKWEAYIRIHSKRIFLGYFSDPAEAAHAYDKAAKNLFGEFARPNFPEGVTAQLVRPTY